MTESLHWIELVISSGLVIAVGRMLVVVGKMMQKQEDHGERLDKIEERLNFPVSVHK